MNLFLTGLETGKSKIKAAADLMCVGKYANMWKLNNQCVIEEIKRGNKSALRQREMETQYGAHQKQT